MVREKDKGKGIGDQGKKGGGTGGQIGEGSAKRKRDVRIGPDTPYGECRERLTGFGGLLGLVMMLFVGFEPGGVKVNIDTTVTTVYGKIEGARRFVVMRIRKAEKAGETGVLFEEEKYTYRVFGTSLRGRRRRVIEEYDQRAEVESCIGESQREGIAAIASRKFQSNHAYFQMVML